MEYLLTGGAAKEVDTCCIHELGIPSVVLMERAACAVAQETDRLLRNRYQGYRQTLADIVAVCGTGNNGADGIAAVRILREMGYHCRICIVGNPQKSTEEFKVQYDIVRRLAVELMHCDNEAKLTDDWFKKDTVIIDALFGIGLSREVSGVYREVIEKINHTSCQVVSVDIASGLEATTGKVMGSAVMADCTVTFGRSKSGMYLCEGKKYSGEVIVKEIGFVREAYRHVEENFAKEVFECFTKRELARLPRRIPTSNKGTYHNVNIAGAGGQMSGAAILAGMAAYSCGAGLVKIYAGERNLDVIKVSVKEAVVNPLSELKAAKLSGDKDIIVAGPGLGISEQAEYVLKEILSSKCKIVLDADALNLISQNNILLEKFHPDVVITPHVKEMSRLTGKETAYIRENMVECAREFSLKYGCVTVIKDAATVICSGEGKVRINTSGNSGMSKGGSGDVLSGIIGGLISQNMSVYEAASLGVYLHGLAGDAAAGKKGEYSMQAGDLVKCIPEVLLKNCENTAYCYAE